MIVSDDRIAPFVAKECGVQIVPPYTAIGIEQSGKIVAGVILNMWTGADIHMTAAGRGWTKGFLAEIGDYVFNKLKCSRITAVTEQDKVVRLAKRLGGEVEGIMRNHFGPNRNAYVIGFLEADWPY